MDCLISGLAGLSSQMGCQMWASGSDMHTQTHTQTLYRQIQCMYTQRSLNKKFSFPYLHFSPSLLSSSVLLSLCLCPHALLVSQCNYRGRGTDQGVYTPGCLHARTHMLPASPCKGIKHTNTLSFTHQIKHTSVVQNVHMYPWPVESITEKKKKMGVLCNTRTHGEEPKYTNSNIVYACCGKMMLHQKGLWECLSV